MDFKHFIFNNFRIVSAITLATLSAILLLVFRIKVTHDFFLLFLGWNLVLAFIPMGIALFLYTYPQLFIKWWFRTLCTLGWLLFFPNAPYVITDFIHLKLSNGPLVILDFVMLFFFAAVALFMGLYSLQLLYRFYLLRFSRTLLDFTLVLVCLLSGYGVYLGRVVRLNSWDVITRPQYTMSELFQNMFSPLAVAYSLVLGLLLFAGHKWLLKRAPLKL